MAVRFLPAPEERPRPPREERGDLAEVIEFRSRLRRPAPEAEPEPEIEDKVEAERPRLVAAVESGFERADADGGMALAVDAGDEPDGPTAYEDAVKLLARKPLSSGELQRALVVAGHPEVDSEEAVATCEESLYLDDAGLACSVATKLRDSKGESKARIRQKLRERLLPDAAIEAALADLDDESEFELLAQTARDRARRMAGLDRQTAERRLLGFLARRGWSGEKASRAAREALDGAGGGPGGGRGTVRFR